MLSDSLLRKLDQLKDRIDELRALMSEPENLNNPSLYQKLTKEHSDLEPLISHYNHYLELQTQLEESKELMSESDTELQELAKEEYAEHQASIGKIIQEIQGLLIPEEENDSANAYLEIRAGTGGDEAAIFSADLLRMYQKYCDEQGWKVETINVREGTLGGIKEVVCLVSGKSVYKILKFESGTHRVQRVPLTESQGRIHTSACTVAVLPEVKVEYAAELDKTELKIDTFRASGAGGQHVNTTDSAVRITHLPTGISVECQDERSQHKNKARAMSLLHAKITDQQKQMDADERSASRKRLVGSGDRSERIRTYNFPQGRITEHRINLTLYKLDDILNGDLNQLLQPLMNEHQANIFAELNQE